MRERPRLPDWGVLVVGLGTMVVPLASAVNVAFPAITHAFGLSLEQIRWVVIVYMLAQASLMLLFGRIGDMVGYRRVFLAGSAVSAAAMALCAAAPSYGWLLVGRVVQGIGAGLVLSCGPALATSVRPEAMRARVLGLYTMLYSLGFALGPVIAGLLVAGFGWPAVFWFRLPVTLAAFVLTWALPISPPHATGQRFDAAGAGLLVGGITLAVLAIDRLQQAAASQGWSAVAGVAAAAALLLFARQEKRATQPILDPAFFGIPGFARINVVAVLVNLACFAVLLLLPFYLARVTGSGPLAIGLVLACSAVGMVLASPLAGMLAERAGPSRLAWVGCGLMAGGLAAVAAAPPLVLLIAALLIQGFGQGLFQVAFLDTVTAALPSTARGVAGSFGMLTRTVGVVLGASLLALAYRLLVGATGALLPALQGVFAISAAIPAVCTIALWSRDGRR